MLLNNNPNMKRKLITPASILFLSIISLSSFAQSKTVKKAQQVNDKARNLKQDSDELTRQAGEVGDNLNSVKSNAKTVVSIFEPILRFRLKKKNANMSTQTPQYTDNLDTSVGHTMIADAGIPGNYTQYSEAMAVTQNDIFSGVPIVAESATYNTDGTANLGSQNNATYGCYLDMVRGQVMDDIDAAGQSNNIDLIFTATGHFNEQVPMYAFLTPAYAKDDGAAYHFFKGTKYKDKNIPPAQWEQVNESEVVMTSLTPAQFEKIQNNNQLMAVVKTLKGFSQKVESRTKLEGKVLAVKTEMGNRTTYGLICIMNHYGTIGSNGYLKIKIKVTGFDNNGDSFPDASIYLQ
jgi:hypothetical protein